MNDTHLPTLLSSSLVADRYRVLRPVGRGATASVYLALDRAQDDRRVVLKVVIGAVAENLAWQFQVLRRITGPGLVQVIELLHANAVFCDGEHLGEPDSARWSVLVCEYVDGQAAGQLAAAFALEPERRLELALSVGAQVAKALAAIHAQGRVHGDVKPENILVSEDGKATVIDFGAARSFGSFGDVFGTPGFLSPEACAGVVDPRGDFYALGVTLCNLLNTRDSSAGVDPVSVAEARGIHGAFHPAPPIPGGVSEQLSKLLAALLEHDLAARPADGTWVSARLAELYREQTGGEVAHLSHSPLPERLEGEGLSSGAVGSEGQGREKGQLMAQLMGGADMVQVVGPAGSGRTRLIRDTIAELQVSATLGHTKAFSFYSPAQIPREAPGFDSILHWVPEDGLSDLNEVQSLVLASRLSGVRLQVVIELLQPLSSWPSVELRPLIEPEWVSLLTASFGKAPNEAVCREVGRLTGGWAGRVHRLAVLARERTLPADNVNLWAGLAAEVTADVAAVPEECRLLVDIMLLCGGSIGHVAIAECVVGAQTQAATLRRLGLAYVAEEGALFLHPSMLASVDSVSSRRRGVALDALDYTKLSDRERAFVCLEEGAFEDALKFFKRIVRSEQERGRHGTVVALLVFALGRSSTEKLRREFRLWLADSHRAQAQYQAACDVLNGVHPEGASDFFLVAEIYRLAGDVGRAERAAREALAAGGACQSVGYAQLSRLALDRGDGSEALRLADLSVGNPEAGEQARCMALEVVAMAAAQTTDTATAKSHVELFLSWTQEDKVSSRTRYRGAATAAYVLSTLGDTVAAQRHNRKAVHLAEAAGELHGAAVSRINVGSAALAHGELAGALTELGEGAAWLCRWGRDREAWRALYNLAHARHVCGDIPRAHWIAEQARAAAERCHSKQGIGVVCSLQAELALAGGALGQAREMLERCLPITDAPPPVQAMVWGRMIEVACGLEDFQGARRTCKELVLLSSQTTSADIQVEGWLGQARVALLDGQAEQGKNAAEQARRLVDESCAFELRLRTRLVVARAVQGGAEKRAALSEARQLLERVSIGLPVADLATLRSSAAYQPAFAATFTEIGAEASAGLAEGNTGVRPGGELRLLHFAKRLLAERRPQRLFELILDCAIELSGAERGYLMTTGQAGEDEASRLRAARGLARHSLPLDPRSLSRSILGQVMVSGRPVATSDAAADVDFSAAESVHAMALKSVAAFPLSWDCEVRGAVYLEDRLRSHAFGKAHMEMLTELFALAGFALEAAEGMRRQRRTLRRLSVARLRLAKQLESQQQELRGLREQHSVPGSKFGLIGQAPEFLKVLSIASRVALSDLSVLIGGESGTGKELLARAIHGQSERSAGPFVAENCGAVPEGLLESTLFGHVRGAFTGASRDRQGLFELADGGTLFLDEVGEMPKVMQVRLLRVLQDGIMFRVGAERPIKVDVRVVAATHRDLPKAVEQGDFREDLYYRLAVVPLILPPLRARRVDIAELASHFITKHGERDARISGRALTVLRNHRWPGNVRQLENEIRRALLLGDGQVEPEHLSPELSPKLSAELHEVGGEAGNLAALDLHGQVAALEKRLVTAALQESAGNQSRAARELGVSRFGLQKMIARLHVTIPGRVQSSDSN